MEGNPYRYATVDPLEAIIAEEEAANRFQQVLAEVMRLMPTNLLFTASQQAGLLGGNPSPWAIRHLKDWREGEEADALKRRLARLGIRMGG